MKANLQMVEYKHKTKEQTSMSEKQLKHLFQLMQTSHF